METEASSIMVSVSLSDAEDEKVNKSEEKVVTNGEKEEEIQESLDSKIETLENERGALAAELMSKDQLIAKLEQESNSFKAELEHLESKHANEKTEFERKILQISEEMGAKVGELKKQYVNANKEKESMVMKYVLNEKEILVQKKHRDEAEKKMKSAVKDKDDAVNKAKTAIADKLKLQQLADSRLQDLNVLKKEIERWKEEVKIQEAKSALSSSRLKSEVDAHKETREKLDKMVNHLTETRAEIETSRKEYSDFIKKLKDDEEAQIKRQKAAEQEQCVKLMIDEAAASELVTLKEKHNKILEENATLSGKRNDFFAHFLSLGYIL